MTVQVVSFHCVLQNRLGQFISSSFNSEVSTNPSNSVEAGELPGFVEALKELKAGEKKRITVPAEKAYGFYYPSRVVEVPRSKLKNGKSLRVGDQVVGSLDGSGEVKSFRVTSAAPHQVTLDGNHPLAGQDLVFDVEMTSLRHENQVPSSAPLYC